MEKKFVCIVCPRGCALTAALQPDGSVQISGNHCPKGAEYGEKEAVHPVRSVTSTVRIFGGVRPLVPVKTQGEIPKEKIFDCMVEIRKLTVAAPVRIGQVLLDNIADTGTALIATGNVPLAEK